MKNKCKRCYICKETEEQVSKLMVSHITNRLICDNCLRDVKEVEE